MYGTFAGGCAGLDPTRQLGPTALRNAADISWSAKSPVGRAKSKRFPLALMARVALTLGLLLWLGVILDLTEVATAFARLQPGFYAVAFALALLDRSLYTWRWQTLLRAREVDIGYWRLFRVQLTAAFMGSFLPNSVAHDALRMVAVSRHTNRSADALGASVVDRAVMVFMTFLFAFVTLLCAMGLFFPSAAVWIISLLLAVFLLGAVTLTYSNLAGYVKPAVGRLLGQDLAGKLTAIYQSIRAFRGHPSALAAGLMIALAMLLLRIVILYFEARSIGVNVDIMSLMLVIPVVWVALMLPVSIGGLGLQEGAFVVVLAQIGVDPAAAVSISVLEHILIRIVCLPGLYCYARHGLTAAPVRGVCGGP